MRRMALTTVLSTFVVTIAAATSLTAQAVQLFVGPPGGTAVGGESNLLSGNASGTGFSVGVAGNHNMQSPLLVILGLNAGSAANETLGFAGRLAAGCPLATPGIYGISANTAMLSSDQNAYQQIGLTDPGAGQASESYTNWAAAAAANGFTVPASYTLEVFAVPAAITGQQGISLSETGASVGSFVTLYSCDSRAVQRGSWGCSGGFVRANPPIAARRLSAGAHGETDKIIALTGVLTGLLI